MPDTKLIFLDIDGTLVRAGENTPPDSALKAIRAAQAKGNKVFLCTGRNPDMLKPLLRFGFDGYVGAAGGYVVVDDEVIYDQPMTKEDTDSAPWKVWTAPGAMRTWESSWRDRAKETPRSSAGGKPSLRTSTSCP